MPTYEYACAACGHQWEAVQRITESPLTMCPSCARSEAHRLISRGTGFILKGGGWYSDLYASPKDTAKPKDGEKAEPAQPSTDTKADASTKSDTKTETKKPSSSPDSSGSAAAA